MFLRKSDGFEFTSQVPQNLWELESVKEKAIFSGEWAKMRIYAGGRSWLKNWMWTQEKEILLKGIQLNGWRGKQGGNFGTPAEETSESWAGVSSSDRFTVETLWSPGPNELEHLQKSLIENELLTDAEVSRSSYYLSTVESE